MSISESLIFSFNNQLSTDYGVINCHVDTNGLYSEDFISSIELKEITTRRSPKPYYVQKKPLPRILNLTIAFENSFDEDKLRSVRRWLSQDGYKPMSFDSIPDYIFYCTLIDSTPLLHSGNMGYINCIFRCSDPYKYSPQYLSDIYDLSSNPSSGTTIIFTNLGDIPCQPQISLLKVNDGDISIINNSDSGKEFKLSSLLDSDGVEIPSSSLKNNEDLFIDSENEEITSSIPDTYRLNNLTGDFISLPRGVNNLQIFGTCKIQFRHQFKMH